MNPEFNNNEELQLINEYTEYIKDMLSIDEVKWSYKKKFTINLNGEDIRVMSFDNWTKMKKREEKINLLLSEVYK